MLVLIAGTTSSAQPTQDIRVEIAALTPNTVYLQISVPRGQTIERAYLTVGDHTIDLDPHPVQLPVNQWFVLDASDGVINTATAIQPAVERFLQGRSDNTQIGGILYDETADIILYPTTQEGELSAWLGQYSAHANKPGCLGDALSKLGGVPRPIDRARRVLLIAGTLSRQGTCHREDIVSVGAPIDIIVTGEDVDNFYRDLAERSDGEYLQANSQNIRDQVNKIKPLWEHPVFLLEANTSLISNSDVGTVFVQLFPSGALVSARVRRFEMLATADDSVEETDSTITLQTMPSFSTTNPNSSADNGNEEQSAVAPTSANPTTQPANNLTVTSQTPPQTENPPPATPAPVVVVASPPLAVNNDNAPVDLPPTTHHTGESTTSSETNVTGDLPRQIAGINTAFLNEINPVLLLGGGVVGFLALIGLVWVVRSPSAPPPLGTIEQNSDVESLFESTMVENDDTSTMIEMEEEGFYDLPMGSPPPQSDIIFGEVPLSDDELDITEMVDNDESLFDETEMVSEEDVIISTKSPIVGLLTQDNTNQPYDIQRIGSVLGRTPDCDILITGDKQISRKHVRFETQDDDQVVVYILTQNPVLVNGSRVRDRVRLQDGDVLQLSQHTRMTFSPVG